MFVQVIQGKVSDVQAIRSRFDEWIRELAHSAEGWLGTTAGVTADGEFVAVVRFEDEEAADRNSDRPEQAEWWRRTSEAFEGEAVFHDYPRTGLFLEGGSDDAGFVQVIQGTYTGQGSPFEDMGDPEEMAEMRPDVIGGAFAWQDEGHFTQTVYFTSEEAAREGERSMSQDTRVSEAMRNWAAHVEGMRFLDLTDPWLASG